MAFSSEHDALSTWEKYTGVGLLSFALLLRIIYDFRYRISSDEPQHLHVAWAWAHGLMQYRDVFDNHTPLFHLLCAPLVTLFGDRPDLLIMMRLTMLPVWGATLWVTYLIGRTLWGRHIGWWAAVLTAVAPPFFLHSVEFRADDLWALLWVLFVFILVNGRPRPLRSFFAGLVLGAAFSVSMKSILFLSSLVLAGLASAILCSRNLYRPGWLKRLTVNLGAGIAGGLLIPLSIVTGFYLMGAFAPFYYDVVQHNLLPGLESRSIIWLRWLFIPALVSIWLLTRVLITKWNSQSNQTTKRAVVFLTLTIYLAVLETLWPLVTKQDRIPMWPLFMIFLISFLDRPLPRRLSVFFTKGLRFSIQVPILLLLVTLCGTIWLTIHIPWKSRTTKNIQTWKAVLILTTPDDYVMDLKGELIFRRRAVYYVFETITKARIAKGLLDPLVKKRLIATRTCVVDDFPPIEHKFIKTNYLSIGPLMVAGKILTAELQQPLFFQVMIPARYSIVTPYGSAHGRLDGLPYHGSCYLSPGRHEFQPSYGQGGRFALVWARAIEKGFSPFRTRGKAL